MTEVEIIQGVIDRLQNPDNWLKFSQAGDADYRYVEPTSPEAVKFCLGGAIINVVQDESWNGWWWSNTTDPVGNRFHQLAIDRGFDQTVGPLVEFNNSPDTTHEDIMLFLKEALYDAQADEAKANT